MVCKDYIKSLKKIVSNLTVIMMVKTNMMN